MREKVKTNIDYRIEVIEKCKEDTLFWFENFAWTFNPREKHSELPFIPYDGKQVRFIKFLDDVLKNPRDIFIDKCRDVGATALMTNFILKQWIFGEFFNARIGSRKEDYVDKAGDPDTLFYKIDYTLQRLPFWMIPEDWREDKHRSYLKLMRPDNSNAIIGESANQNFARGGRQTMVFFDEIGFWPFARSAWESAGDVTDIRIAMTTPPETGKSSHAYKLFSGQAGEVETFSFDYTDIPTKTNAWIAKQKTRRSSEEFEREVMKSYSGTAIGKVYAAEWRLHVSETKIEYDPQLPLFVSWDFGLDTTAMIWIQKDIKTNQIKVIDYYENINKTPDFYVPFVTGAVKSGIGEYKDEDLKKIGEHKNWRKDVSHFGDPDVVKRAYLDKRSAFGVLKEAGIYVTYKPWGGRTRKDLIGKTKLMFRRMSVDSVKCEHFINCMLSCKWPKKAETAQPTTEPVKPVHDWAYHAATALDYFADNEPMAPKKVERPKGRVTYKYKPRGGYQ